MTDLHVHVCNQFCCSVCCTALSQPQVSIDDSKGFVCYASTDCHGHVVSVGSSKGDCCASDSGSLSFSKSGDCSNCFCKFV